MTWHDHTRGYCFEEFYATGDNLMFFVKLKLNANILKVIISHCRDRDIWHIVLILTNVPNLNTACDYHTFDQWFCYTINNDVCSPRY